MRSVRTLMTGLIDDAGLFPPAGLDMRSAIARHATDRAGADSWMLGRLIVPVSRLDEFEQAAIGSLPTIEDAEPWRISALVGERLADDLDRIDAFNQAHSTASHGRALIDSIEIKAATVAAIDSAARKLPDGLRCHVEIPIERDPRGLITALAGDNLAAKVRTGGLTSDAFPSADDLARFVLACAASQTPFKATAGLHHPVRGPHRITDDDQSASALMHGFLNLFVAAALARASLLSHDEAVAILDERDATAFAFDESGMTWRDRRLTCDQLAEARRRFAISVGSCSFHQPRADLRLLNLLRP